MIEAAKLGVTISADSSSAQKSLASLGTSVASAGKGFSALDEVVTGVLREVGAAVTNAFAGMTTAMTSWVSSSVDSATAYQKSLAMIRGLTENAKGDVEIVSSSILELTKTIPISADEMANAAYFIGSAGYSGAAGIQVLTQSAKAAAAGLGDTTTIADAVTSALTAYKMSAEEAGRVTDVMTNIVIQGKTAPAALAGALGRVLPIASAAGVEFEDIAASVATMTKVGMSAEESIVALRGILGALIAPGSQATDALASVGLSTDELRKSIRDDGLLIALKDLMERTGGNIETLDLIIPNIRALTGVLATVGSQSETYTTILGTMFEATGRTNKGFEDASKTYLFQASLLRNNFEGVAIRLGTAVIPAMTSAMYMLQSAVQAVSPSIGEWVDNALIPANNIVQLHFDSKIGRAHV